MSTHQRNRVQIGTSFRGRVYAVVAKIPTGKVLTYGEVAKWAGNARAARAVGTAMRENPDPKRVPCHRVVRANGTVGDYAFGGARAKVKKLKSEGVAFSSHNKVKITKY